MKRHTTHLHLIGLLALAGTLWIGAIANPLRAQNLDDLLRYSVLNPSGSPRFTAMGGAFGALGGNFSAATVNPAGLGLYSRDEFSLSGSVTSGNGRANYYGETHRDREIKVNLPQAGIVWTAFNSDKETGFKRFQVAFGMNRIDDYTGAFYISGFNPQSSYMEVIAAQNHGAIPDNLNDIGGLAYDSYLMDEVPIYSCNFYTFLTGGGLNQSQQWYTNGNNSEMLIGFSGNISDKVYIGLSFNVPFIHYYYRSTLSETVPDEFIIKYHRPLDLDQKPDLETHVDTIYFKSYDLNERASVSGSGFTFKIGVMYQALPYMRIGAWFHSPTYLSATESYNIDLITNTRLVNRENKELEVPSGSISSEYSYKIRTPLRAGVALGFIIGQYGVVDVEGEIVDYTGMRLDSRGNRAYAQKITDLVKDQYQTGGVFRVGTEWRAGIGRFRAGYAFNSSPFRDKSIRKAWQNHTVSAGVGLAFGRWNIDFTVAYYLQKQDYHLYNIVDQNLQPLVQAANLTQNKLVYNLGFAVKF